MALAETQILLLLVAVAGASLVALIWGTNAEDRALALRHNLLKLRDVVRKYHADHLGRFPAELVDLTCSSNLQGESSGSREVTAEFPLPAYLWSLPENPLSRQPIPPRPLVRHIGHDPARASDLTPGNEGGWLYSPTTGGVWADHDPLFRL
jgi:hypothetical protein